MLKIFLKGRVAFIFSCLLAWSITANAQSVDQKEKIAALYAILSKYHVDPPAINDSTSSQIFELFIERLDPSANYLSKADIKGLDKYRFEIDNLIIGTYSDLIKDVTTVYRKKLHFADSITSAVLSKPLVYKSTDSILFYYSAKTIYSDNDKDLEARLRRWMIYRVLQKYAESSDSVKLANSKIPAEYEEKLRKKIAASEHSRITRIIDHSSGLEEVVLGSLLNAIALRYDPHSSYFTISDKKEFDASLNSRSMSFGFALTENANEDIEITGLVPGGPAWKSNLVNNGDRLSALYLKEKKRTDVSMLSLSEVNSLLSSFTGTKLSIELVKKDQSIVTVELKEEKLDNQSNIVRSYILEGEKKVGYISLPAFYSDELYRSNLGCANDVAKEIIKLQKENIEGLILDMRFNGGGLLSEAIDLAGIFIDEGPFFIQKSKEGKPYVIKDSNRGTVYNGPLQVLVNGFSASASEFVAGVIQDYKRGLIVGSPTYGKATSQIVLPLRKDIENVMQLASFGLQENPNGYIKFTDAKFFRVTGSTHQKAGVIPDIHLPDFSERDFYHEKGEAFCLSSDSIAKKVFYTPLPNSVLDPVKEKSMKRVESSKAFSKAKYLNDSLTSLFSRGISYSLTPAKFLASYKDNPINQLIEKLSELSEKEFKPVNNKFDAEVLSMDEFKKTINEQYLVKLTTDMYLQEAYRVMCDQIRFSTNQ